MATEIETAFVLLREAAEAAGQNQFITRDVGVPGVQAALDHGGRKHLLLVVDGDMGVPTDVKSAGVHLVSAQMLVEGRAQNFAVLRCVDGSLDLVFDHLADDVVSRVNSGGSPVDAAREALDDWRAMLRQSSDLSASQIVGLCAELEVLRRAGAVRKREALDSWTGPTGSVHDFVLGHRAIEVKGTARREGNSVGIHGLDQLDPGDQHQLYLAVVHCVDSPTAPTLDERIRTLIESGFSRTELLDKVHGAGYAFESPASRPTQYEIKSLRVWEVTPDFPGLRRSNLSPVAQSGVSQVQFSLNLDAAPPALPVADMEGFWTEWTT